MGFVGRVTVGVGLDSDDRPVRDFRLRQSLDLGGGVPCKRGLVASLHAHGCWGSGGDRYDAIGTAAVPELEPEPLAALAIP